MKLSDLNNITTADEAEQKAKDWQVWASDRDLSYNELAGWSTAFRALAKKFDLVEVFEENGII